MPVLGRFYLRILIVSLSIIIGPATSLAHYLNPTTAADCNLRADQYEFNNQLETLSARISQCLKQPGQGSWISIPACGYGGTQLCAPLEEQRCEVENHMRVVREQCVARLDLFRAEQERKRLIEEQAEREAAKFQQDAAKHAIPGNMPADFSLVQNSTQGFNVARLGASAYAGANLNNAGGLYLSSALTAAGLRAANALQAEALSRFENAMAGISALEAGQGRLQGDMSMSRAAAHRALERDFNAIETRIQAAQSMLEHTLPLGGASAVVGDNADRLTQIVTAIADGTIDASIWSMNPAQLVAAIEQKETIEANRAARLAANPELAEAIDQRQLYERRIWAHANLIQLPAPVSPPALPDPTPVPSQSTSDGLFAGLPACFEVEELDRDVPVYVDDRPVPDKLVRNRCNRAIVIRNKSECDGGTHRVPPISAYPHSGGENVASGILITACVAEIRVE